MPFHDEDLVPGFKYAPGVEYRIIQATVYDYDNELPESYFNQLVEQGIAEVNEHKVRILNGAPLYAVSDFFGLIFATPHVIQIKGDDGHWWVDGVFNAEHFHNILTMFTHFYVNYDLNYLFHKASHERFLSHKNNGE